MKKALFILLAVKGGNTSRRHPPLAMGGGYGGGGGSTCLAWCSQHKTVAITFSQRINKEAML